MGSHRVEQDLAGRPVLVIKAAGGEGPAGEGLNRVFSGTAFRKTS